MSGLFSRRLSVARSSSGIEDGRQIEDSSGAREVIDLDSDDDCGHPPVNAEKQHVHEGARGADAPAGGATTDAGDGYATDPDVSEDDVIEEWGEEQIGGSSSSSAPVEIEQASTVGAPATTSGARLDSMTSTSTRTVVTSHASASSGPAMTEAAPPDIAGSTCSLAVPGTPLQERLAPQDTATPRKTPKKQSRELVEDTAAESTPKRFCSGDGDSYAVASNSRVVGPTPWVRLPGCALDPYQSLGVFLVSIDERHRQPPAGFEVPNVPPGNSVPILELHGCTQQGCSVLLHVHGFQPYLYAKRPASGTSAIWKAALESLRLNTVGPVVAMIEEVERMPLMQYQSKCDQFVRIVLTSQKVVAACRSALERGVSLRDGTTWASPCFEANVPLTLRFLVDVGAGGGSWIEVLPGRYVLRSAAGKRSNAQYEADVHWSHVRGHAAEGEWMGVPPLRLLSLHLQTVGPNSEVAAAASVLHVQGEETPRHAASWMVGADRSDNQRLSTAGTHGVLQVFKFSSEAELLTHMRSYIVEADPDVIIGYDLLNVHLASMLQRATASGAARRCCYALGRFRSVASVAKSSTFETRQLGKHESMQINVEGRLLMDVLTILEREQKLDSYSLSALAFKFLGSTRLELRPSAIEELARADPARLGNFALRDARFSLEIFRSQQCLFRFVEMGRVTGVPIEYLLTRGQSVKIFSMLLRKARAHSFVLPPPVRGGSGEDSSYEGGAVLEPLAGFYDAPVVTLDFASLYPSIMQRHNLCYSTLLPQGAPAPVLEASNGYAVENVPFLGHRFVSAHVRKGLIPMVLKELLAARKAAKKELKAATDPQMRAVLDGRQLALKVSANSVYGFTGMNQGTLPCQAIAASVTAYGRQMIERTRQVIEERFCKEKCFDANAKVIYGDTDSVMVTLGPDFPLQRAFDFGKEAAELATREFGAPVAMEFEKVYFPYLLMSKKRYAGVAWSQPNEPGKLDAKGIEVVRRDWCGLVRESVDRCLHLLLRERDVERAVEYARQAVSSLRQGTVDQRLLVISKSLVREGANAYAGKQAHVELAERLRRRDPQTAPQVGDRVAYVFIVGPPGTPAYERVEDPLYAMDNNLPLDADYYVDHQLKQPLLRIFGPVLRSEAVAEKRLFGGDLARRVPRAAPSGGGPLAAFARARARCLGCRSLLSDSSSFLCRVCAEPERASEVVLKHVDSLRNLEVEMANMLSSCARCEGSTCNGLHKECANVDCPIFFRRPYVAREIDVAEKALQNLQLDW